MPGRRQGDAKEFRELTFAEQAKSITATINNLQAAIEHHIEHSPKRQETAEKCLAQLDRFRERLRSLYAPRVTPPAPGGTEVAPPPARTPLSLEQLLEGVNQSNLHSEWDTGPPVGKEAW